MGTFLSAAVAFTSILDLRSVDKLFSSFTFPLQPASSRLKAFRSTKDSSYSASCLFFDNHSAVRTIVCASAMSLC